jgi:hypothetical protein
MFLFWDYIVEASRGGGSLRLVSHDINTPSNRLYKALRSTAYGASLKPETEATDLIH